MSLYKGTQNSLFPVHFHTSHGLSSPAFSSLILITGLNPHKLDHVPDRKANRAAKPLPAVDQPARVQVVSPRRHVRDAPAIACAVDQRHRVLFLERTGKRNTVVSSVVVVVAADAGIITVSIPATVDATSVSLLSRGSTLPVAISATLSSCEPQGTNASVTFGTVAARRCSSFERHRARKALVERKHVSQRGRNEEPAQVGLRGDYAECRCYSATDSHIVIDAVPLDPVDAVVPRDVLCMQTMALRRRQL